MFAGEGLNESYPHAGQEVGAREEEVQAPGEIELGAREEVVGEAPEPYLYNAEDYEVVTECYEEVCETTATSATTTVTTASTEDEVCPAPSEVSTPHTCEIPVREYKSKWTIICKTRTSTRTHFVPKRSVMHRSY